MEDLMEAPAADAVETTAPEAVEAEQPIAEGAEAPAETAGDENQPAEEGKNAAEPDIYSAADGKKIPAKFAPLFKQHPELRAMFFENREVRSAGGAKALMQAARQLEEIGGREGIEQQRSEIEQWSALDQLFSAGDPKLAEHLFEADKAAAVKLAPAIIEQFRKAEPEGFSRILARDFLGTLQNFDAHRAITALHQLGSENEQIKQAVQPLIELWNTVYEIAQKEPEKKPDPERQQFEQERQQFQQERQQAFERDVIGDATGHLKQVAEDHLGRYFTQGGLDLKALRQQDPDAWNLPLRECEERLAKAIEGDPVFQRNKNALYEAKDAGGLKSLYRKKIDQALPTIARDVHARFTRYGGQPGKRTVAPAAKPAAPTVLTGTKPPHEAGMKIDWSRVPSGFSRVEDAVLSGRAYVHGRKEVYAWK